MATALQNQFKKAMSDAEAIKASVEAKGGNWAKEDQAAFESKIAEAKGFQALLEKDTALDALKAWGNNPQGSAVAGAFVGETLGDEGTMKGLTASEDMRQVVVDEKMPDEYKSLGAAKLKILNSGLYKDAFAQKIRAQGLHGQNWQRHMKAAHLEVLEMKVLQEGLDGSGAEWVPPDMRSEVISKIATVPGVYNDVYKFTTGSNNVVFPKVVYTTDDLYTTGIAPAWTAEAPSSNISESTNPVSGYESIPVHTMTAAVLVSRAMLEDNVFDIVGYISAKIGENIPLFLNNALINGDGVGKPQGILNHALAQTLWSTAGGGMQVLSGASGAVAFGAAGSTATGIYGMEAVLPPQYEAKAKWYATKLTYGAIRSINVGTANQPMWKPEDFFPNALNGYAPRLLGYPVVKDQFMPAISTSTQPLMLGDLSGYYAPQRVGITIEVLRELFALRDIVCIYARMRVGGQVVEPWKFKLMKSHSS